MDRAILEGRHPGTAQVAQFFASDHLSPSLQPFADWCTDVATSVILALPDSPELTAGLRKLLEAKDCFVRAALVFHRPPPE